MVSRACPAPAFCNTKCVSCPPTPTYLPYLVCPSLHGHMCRRAEGPARTFGARPQTRPTIGPLAFGSPTSFRSALRAPPSRAARGVPTLHCAALRCRALRAGACGAGGRSPSPCGLLPRTSPVGQRLGVIQPHACNAYCKIPISTGTARGTPRPLRMFAGWPCEADTVAGRTPSAVRQATTGAIPLHGWPPCVNH